MEGKAPQRACSQAKHLLYQNNFIVLIQYCYFVTTDVLVGFFFKLQMYLWVGQYVDIIIEKICWQFTLLSAILLWLRSAE